MPSKKKKYNARFPAGRIKKIMQSDEEIGKVAQAVPVIISRTLELFVESLLTKTLKITNSRNAKTLSPSHMKQCIMSENRFDFLRELVKCIPDISVAEEVSYESSPEATIDHSDTPYDLSMPSTSNNIETSIQAPMSSKGNVSIIINNDVNKSSSATHTVSQLQSETLNYGGSDNSENHSKSDFLNSKIDHQEAKSGHLSICSRSVSTECTPQLFADTHSVPAGTQSPQVKTNALSPQQHQQLQATDLRRIRHQTKFESESTNICNDTVMLQKSNAKPQTPTAMIRAPIVSIDFCNKPVVKIDYSNLALHDTNYSVAAPLSSSSPTLEQINKIPLNDDKAHISLSAINPVINIDLSNIVTCEALSSSKLYSSIVKPSCAEVSVTPTLPPASTTYKTTCFELDEDYDNI